MHTKSTELKVFHLVALDLYMHNRICMKSKFGILSDNHKKRLKELSDPSEPPIMNTERNFQLAGIFFNAARALAQSRYL